MIQHQVTGNKDQSMSALAAKYGCDWKDIGNATFGQWGASFIYPWLRDNGGEAGQEANVPTGRHWFWAPGMVVNVPVSGASKSPVDSFSNPIPGGPLVTVEGLQGSPLTGREPAPDPEEYAANESDALAKADAIAGMTSGDPYDNQPGPEEAKIISTASVAGIGTGILIVGLGIGILLMGRKKGKKGKLFGSKKKAKRRRRRR